MTTPRKDPVIVVVQLSGGNDYLNTVVPYGDPAYYDSRRTLNIPEDQVIHIDDMLGFHPAMGPIARMFAEGDVAIIHGIGYQNSVRSHFRSMDIWHTCEPVKVGTEGWLGRATRELDPAGENPVTAVNFGHGLPRALVVPGVSVASVADLASYGLLPGIQEQQRREQVLRRFANIYAPSQGAGQVMDYLGQTGRDALKGADILKAAPERYQSTVEYADTGIARSLRDVAMTHLAGLGTRIFYTQHGSYDTHAGQAPALHRLWSELSVAISDFWDDLREHAAADNVIMYLFSEFGRRVRDNGSGTDHGAAGVSFVIGPGVKGGMYSTYPDIRAQALDQGDLVPNVDFRSSYSTILEDWLGLDSVPIVNGTFEKLGFLGNGSNGT